jgi:hypothetical protein
MAQLLLERDKLEAARFHLERALMLREQTDVSAKQLARLYYLLALTAWRAHDNEGAISWADRAKRVYSESPEPAAARLEALMADVRAYRHAAELARDAA